MPSNPFKLEKLRIYKWSKDAKVLGISSEWFEAMFNPETYSLDYELEYSEGQGMNTSGGDPVYNLTRPRRLALDLIIDGTGAAQFGYQTWFGFKPHDITSDLENFLDLAARYNGEIHQPNPLRIEWGELVFDCYLKNVTIKYTLFNRNGKPLRAELATQFIQRLEDDKRVKLENKSSPDLTHVRTVGAGDTLPMMAWKIYHDPAYYIKVAEANRLNNFRRPEPGKTLRFPPVEEN